MIKLGLRIGWMACVALVGCDGGDEDETDSGMVDLVDSGPQRDAGMRDAGPRPDSGPRPDGGGGGGGCGPTTGMCDVSDPSSCGTGMACVLRLNDMDEVSTFCVPAGTGTNGATCDPAMQGQCAEGFDCPLGETACRAYCCSAADCPVPGQICNLFADTNDAGMCADPDSCTLVSPQTGCEAGEACNFLGGATGDVICDPEGTLGEGAECAARNACLAGLGCVGGAGEPGRCRAWCDLNAADPCPELGTLVCVGVTGAPTGVGVCVPSTTT